MKNQQSTTGYTPNISVVRNAALAAAIAEFRQNGGTHGEAIAILNAAYGGSKKAGEGHLSAAEQAHDNAPASAPKSKKKKRNPGHAKRGAEAIASIQGTLAKSLFDQTVLPDGRKLREIRWSECPNLAAKYRRFSRIFMAIHNYAVPADPNTTLDNVVGEDHLKDIMETVERFNDIH